MEAVEPGDSPAGGLVLGGRAGQPGAAMVGAREEAGEPGGSPAGALVLGGRLGLLAYHRFIGLGAIRDVRGVMAGFPLFAHADRQKPTPPPH